MGISSVNSGTGQDLKEELTLRRREGPLFARVSLSRGSQFGGSFQKDSNNNWKADHNQTFSNVLTKPPGGGPTGVKNTSQVPQLTCFWKSGLGNLA